MNDRTNIDPTSLPALQDLHKATAGIVFLAAFLLVTAVLPAELGVDPTGVGGWLGLTAMGDLKHAGAAPEDASPGSSAAPSLRTDEFTVTLGPKEGTEVKAVMRAGDQMVYSWTSDQGEVFFDFHGEPKGAAANVFTSFEKGRAGSAQGEFEAPFEGVHGWYWQNVGREPVTVHLKVTGVYSKISRLH